MALSASELASMQAAIQTQIMDKTCSIQRATASSDGQGHTTQTYATIASNVACALNKPSGGWMIAQAAKMTDVSTWALFVPIGTDIQHKDHIVIAGSTYTIQTVFSPETFQLVLSALVTQVR